MPTITVLHIPGCAGGKASLEIAERVAALRADVRVVEVTVIGDADATDLGFRGSPTILIDERDIEKDPQAPLGSMG